MVSRLYKSKLLISVSCKWGRYILYPPNLAKYKSDGNTHLHTCMCAEKCGQGHICHLHHLSIVILISRDIGILAF